MAYAQMAASPPAELSDRYDSFEVLAGWRDFLNLTVAPNTRRTYERGADLFLRTLRKPLVEVDEEDVVRWLTSYPERSSRRTTYYYAVRSLFKWCRRRGYMLFDPLEAIPAPQRDEKEVEALTPDEVSRLAYALACRSPFRGLVILLLYYSGMRIGEATSLLWGDVRADHIVIRQTKGRRDRRVPLSRKLRLTLEGLREYRKDDRVVPRCSGTVHAWMTDIRGEVGIHRLHPHLMRSTFATVIADYGPRDSTFALQKLLGHVNVKTTQRYVKDNEEKKRDLMEVVP